MNKDIIAIIKCFVCKTDFLCLTRVHRQTAVNIKTCKSRTLSDQCKVKHKYLLYYMLPSIKLQKTLACNLKLTQCSLANLFMCT